jgi:membrane protein required for colicin V production
VVAALMAIFGLPVFAPLFREVIDGWLGTVLALVVVFGVTYALLRLIGSQLARQVQRTQMLGFLDRSVGLLIGLGRGLLVLGVLFLMFTAATPEDLRPRWITESTTWPLARNMGGMIQRLAPQGLDFAGRLKPAFDRAVSLGSGDRTASDGYEARQRGETDGLERSR